MSDRSRRAALLVALLALAVFALGYRLLRRRYAPPGITTGGPPATSALTVDDSAAMAPAGVRVRVQVLNTTSQRGLARRAMLLLRDRGFDVVETGGQRPPRDSTLVLDRSGHPDWARRVAAALGGARVESRPDSSRYLDVTVLLGSAWRPPPQALRP